MTTVEINLPDQLAQEARQAGLLTSAQLERWVREQLREARIERMQQTRELLAKDPVPAMTATEIQAEIDAFRAEQRAIRS